MSVGISFIGIITLNKILINNGARRIKRGKARGALII
jgi:hypothetical protein